MFGLFRRRPRSNAEAIERVRVWIAEHLHLGEDDAVFIAELACHELGCPDRETVVTVIYSSRDRLVLRFPGAMADVTETQVEQVIAQQPAP